MFYIVLSVLFYVFRFGDMMSPSWRIILRQTGQEYAAPKECAPHPVKDCRLTVSGEINTARNRWAHAVRSYYLLFIIYSLHPNLPAFPVDLYDIHATP